MIRIVSEIVLVDLAFFEKIWCYGISNPKLRCCYENKSITNNKQAHLFSQFAEVNKRRKLRYGESVLGE